jgi:hypothetical protein
MPRLRTPIDDDQRTLTLSKLLQPFGLDAVAGIKLVRHQDKRVDIDQLRREGLFEAFQAIQSRTVFSNCESIVSFVGQPGSHALFVGVYRVRGVEGPRDFALPRGVVIPGLSTANCYRYTLDRDDRFADLVDRLVVDWGGGTRSWVQKYRAPGKPVVEILPKGYVRDFPGFLDVVLRHDELVSIVKHPVAHRDWHRMLKSVAAVYLILDTRTGNQYVGSAYGERGLLGRWMKYADTPHGGNEQLKSLIAARPFAARDFQFSILQILPITQTANEVMACEALHKRKLGTRAHGLNSN